MDIYRTQTWKVRLDPTINPFRKYLGCRIFETFNLIQIIMVKHIVKRLPGTRYLRKIYDHTRIRVHIPGHNHIDLIAVTMETATFMPGRHAREPMGCFKSECFGQRYRHFLYPESNYSHTTRFRIPDHLVNLKAQPHRRVTRTDPAHQI